jgi:hypothetical protein
MRIGKASVFSPDSEPTFQVVPDPDPDPYL